MTVEKATPTPAAEHAQGNPGPLPVLELVLVYRVGVEQHRAAMGSRNRMRRSRRRSQRRAPRLGVFSGRATSLIISPTITVLENRPRTVSAEDDYRCVYGNTRDDLVELALHEFRVSGARQYRPASTLRWSEANLPGRAWAARAAQDSLLADAVDHEYRTSQRADSLVTARQGIACGAMGPATDMQNNNRGLKVR